MVFFRRLVAVVAGYGLWTLLWLAGNKAFFAASAGAATAARQPFGDVPTLCGLLVLAIACSLAAGILSARLLPDSRPRPVLVPLCAALLASGAIVTVQLRELLPVWYHVLFLVLLAPMTLLGMRLGTPRSPTPSGA